VVKSDKCVGDSYLGHAPGLPPKSTPMFDSSF